MKNGSFTSELPTWVECFHKRNKIGLQYNRLRKNLDYYKFVIIKNKKYQNPELYMAGYFRWSRSKIHLDIDLFKVYGFDVVDAYNNAIQKYRELSENGLFLDSGRYDEKIWSGDSPYDE